MLCVQALGDYPVEPPQPPRVQVLLLSPLIEEAEAEGGDLSKISQVEEQGFKPRSLCFRKDVLCVS